MFEKFGEFDTLEELNAAAEGQKEQGDRKALLELAKENGIDIEDAEDYMDGYNDELATLPMAAYGRISIEQAESEKRSNYIEVMIMNVIISMLKGLCTDPLIMAAVIRKGKRISAIMQAIKEEASKHKSGNMGIACGTDRELCEIIRAYYLESDKEFKAKIAKLYDGIKDKENKAKEEKKNNKKKGKTDEEKED